MTVNTVNIKASIFYIVKYLFGVYLGFFIPNVFAQSALDYRAIVDSAVIVYDSPSLAYGKKLYVLKRFTPVEVIVKSGDWVRIRDAEGSLAWVEAKSVGNERTVVVIVARADLRGQANDNAPVIFSADKWTAFSLLKIEDNGWLKLRHLNGALVYGKISHFWGV